MTTLSPIKEPTEEYEKIERLIIELFKKEIYLPILKEFSQSQVLKNAKDALVEAFNSGRITYNRGVFSGRFNSTISKELKELGAVWHRSSGTWRLPLKLVPMDLRNIIAASEFRFKKKLESVDRKLALVLPEEIVDKLKIEKMFDTALWKTDKAVRDSVGKISLVPQLTPERRKRIAEEWQNNMKLWIKDWTETEIVKLRKQMQQSVFAANRFESAISTIKDSFGVSRNKAKFLARQETKLLTTKFKEIRYQEAGVHEYYWKSVKGSPAHPVRPMHKQLNDRSERGEIFRFDAPPVDDPNGARHNPGENYNCRCVAIPVVRFK